MNYKRNSRVLLLSLLGTLFIFSIYVFFSPTVFNAKKNVENVKNAKIGMDKNEVLKIMGTPDNRRISFLNSIDSMYYYEPPFGASEGIYIQFDSSNVVNKIVDYEKFLN